MHFRKKLRPLFRRYKVIGYPYSSDLINGFAANGNNVFAATQSNVFLSTDSGMTWTAANNGLPSASIVSIAISGTKVFAGTIGHSVYYSTNNGSSWTSISISGGLGNYVYSLLISGSDIYAGTGNGVFTSNINGPVIWNALNSGLKLPALCAVNSLAADTINLYAGIGDVSVWKRLISEIVSTNEKPNQIKITIYPNPAKDIVNISLDKNIKQGEVDIFNMMGEKVYTEAFNGKQKTVNCKLSAGIYFVQLRSETQQRTQKIIIEQ